MSCGCPWTRPTDWGSRFARAILGLIFLCLFAKFTLRCRSREDLVDNWAWIMISFLLTSSYLFPGTWCGSSLCWPCASGTG